jgi:hypothetical protein
MASQRSGVMRCDRAELYTSNLEIPSVFNVRVESTDLRKPIPVG